MSPNHHAPETPAAPGPGARIRSLVRLALALTPLVLAGIYATLVVVDRTPRWVYWAVGLRVLQAIEAVYILGVLGSIPGLALAIRSLRRDGGSPRRERAYRVLLLIGSILPGAATMEAASALILTTQDRRSSLPAGVVAADREEPLGGGRFPKPADDVALPTEFPEASDRLTIAVVGESSAAGVPFDRWFSIGSVLTWSLERAIPGRSFQVEILATSGDTLEGQHRKLASLRNRPDVLIVYCGHNEFSARLPQSRDRAHYADADEPSPLARLAGRALSWSSVHALARRNMEKCRIAIPPPPNGRRALVDAPAYSSEEYDLLLADFRRRLGAIADYAEKLGSILVLIAPPGNDSGYDPNRSYLPPATPEAVRRSVAHAYREAKERDVSDPSAAERGYRDLLAREPGFAAARWRLSRLLAGRGDAAGAYEQAVAARDLDGYPQRCPTDFQEAYREVARRHDAIYIDGQAYFHALSPDGLLDDRLFHDAMHPSYRGQLALGQAVLRGLHARGAFGWPADAPEPILDPAECASHFGLDPDAWRTLCLWGMMSYEITGPASYDPTLRRSKYEAFARAADAIEAGVPPAAAGFPGIGRMDPIPLVPYGDANSPPAAAPVSPSRGS